MEQILIWIILTLTPLVPTYVTHKFLQSNSFYQNASKGIKLSGAIAAYVILLYAAFHTYNSLSVDPYNIVRQNLVGEWSCVSTVKEASIESTIEKTYESKMSIYINGAKTLSINGGTDALNMRWQAQEIFITHKQLVYIFKVFSNDANGITWLNFTKNSNDTIPAMFGRWVFAGAIGKGTLGCYREEEPVKSNYIKKLFD